MHYKDITSQKHLTFFISLSNSNSNTSRKNESNKSKVTYGNYSSSSFFSDSKNHQFSSSSKKVLSLNSESDSLSFSLPKIRNQIEIINNIKSNTPVLKGETKIYKKILEKKNMTKEDIERSFFLLNSDNKSKDEYQRIKYYTPKKIMLHLNLINKGKKNAKNILFSNVNYYGKNLIDDFKKAEQDINEDNSDISFSPIPSFNNNIDKLKNELDFNKKLDLGLNNCKNIFHEFKFNNQFQKEENYKRTDNILKRNKAKYSNKIKLILKKQPNFNNSVKISFDKNNNECSKKDHIINKYTKFKYNSKKNIKIINIKNKIININKKNNNNKERIKRSNSFNEYKNDSYNKIKNKYFNKFIFYNKNNVIKSKNNKKIYNNKNL